jgi:hypothetical protein
MFEALRLILTFATLVGSAAPVARITATTANLKDGPESVRIDVLAWSTDAARRQFLDAWNLIAPVTAARGAAGGRGAVGGRGARGGGPPAAGARRGVPAPEPAAESADTRDTPEKSLAAALQAADGVGYLWTSESTGYSLRYAYRLAEPDGSERIILATDRQLGDRDNSWQPASGKASDSGFSVIELRLNANHEGEGKASVSGKVTVDSSANTISLDGYAALPVLLRNVKLRSTN